MSDRISISGRGKELFFGEGTDDVQTGAVDDPFSSDRKDARQIDSLLSAKTESQIVRKTDSKTARQTGGSPLAGPSLDMLRRLRDVVAEQHPVHNTFRYSQQALDAVRDIVYELEVARGVKTSRNDVMRLALAWIVDDYRENGAASVLVKVLKQERWKPDR